MTEKVLSPIEKYQNEEKERLEYESYCNKIRQGIESLDEKSGERAIWELIQNARDMGECVCIRIELLSDKIIFSHHGKPFDYTSLRALVKQDSSKDKTGADLVGQYGTGFMTTHAFNRKVYVSGPYEVKSNKNVIDGYVMIRDFELDRSKVDVIEGIDEMRNELKKVDLLYREHQYSSLNEWTSFRYDLNTEQIKEVSRQLSNAIRLMPFVLVINNKIQKIEINNHHTKEHIQLSKSHEVKRKPINVADGWVETINYIKLMYGEEQEVQTTLKSLVSANGEDVVIIPPFAESCGSVENIPSLFLWFPLLGTEKFGVNFIFHSKQFYPVEKRNNIMLPENALAKMEKGQHNEKVLRKMMSVLFNYYSLEENSCELTREMCQVSFPTDSEDEITKRFYADLQDMWKVEIPQWKIIPTKEGKMSMCDARVRVLHPDFYNNLTLEQRAEYEPILIVFVQMMEQKDEQSYLLPNTDLIKWSEIVNEWKCCRDAEFFITVENVCNAVQSKSDDLHKFLLFLKESGNEKLMEKYPLLPNRKGILCKKGELCHGSFMTEDVYELTNVLMGDDSDKMIDPHYLDICTVSTYEINNLRGAITNNMIYWRKSILPNNGITSLGEERINALISFCSATSQNEFTNFRGRIMPLITLFYEKRFEKKNIAKLEEKEEEFYDSPFNLLLDYTLYQLSLKDSTWVSENKALLLKFLTQYSTSTSIERSNKLDDYGVIPCQSGCLCKKKDLLFNDGIPKEMADIYKAIFNKDLHDTWVDVNFQDLFKFTPQKPKEIATEIERILEDDMKRDGNERSFDKIMREVILKLEEPSDWCEWFNHINQNKAKYTFNMQTGAAQKSLFSLMDLEDDSLIRLARLKEKGSMSDLIEKMERQQQLDEEKNAKFNFCLRIGKYIENEIRQSLQLKIIEVKTRGKIDEILEADDIQNGQDIIIRIHIGAQVEDIYYVEVKAKWNFEFDNYAHMSINQLRMAAKNPKRYALCCVNLTHTSTANIPADSSEEFIKEHVQEIIDNTKVHMLIGEELQPIMKPIMDAENDSTETKMRIGDYRGNITQTAFMSGEPFSELITKIIERVNEVVSEKTS